MTSANAIRSFECEGCKSSVTKRCPEGTKFCSLKCYRSSPRPARRTGSAKQCGACGKEMYRAKSASNGDCFCSSDCHNQYQSRFKTIHFCKVCETEFKWSPSRVKRQNPTYCSIACRDKCDEWKLKAVVAGNLAQMRKSGPNRLELAGAEIFNMLNVDWIDQHLLCKKFLVDAYIPSSKVVVQWDGDYWHGLKPSGNNGTLTARQRSQIRKDLSTNAYLAKSGYTVLRFFEYTVKNHPEHVLETIRSSIQTIAA